MTTLRRDPVILLGMHHSGTSIFSEVLHRHGVFMHPTAQRYESKLFTRDINGNLIMGGRNRWSRVPILSVEEVMASLEVVREVVDRKAYKKLVSDGYDGHSRWGFKDPRTCVTIPLFLEIFPEAQILHIVRDPRDVAESIATKTRAGERLHGDRDHWVELARQHVERARHYGKLHGKYFEFTYEEFCLQPAAVTDGVFRFLDVPVTDELMEFLDKTIYTHRIGIAPAPEQG